MVRAVKWAAALAATLVLVGCTQGESGTRAPSAQTTSQPASTDRAAEGRTPPRQSDFASSLGKAFDGTSQFTRVGGEVAPPRAKPGELLVKFKPNTSRLRIAAALPRASVASIRPSALVPGLQHVKLAPNVALESALAEYRARADVEYAEPNYIVHINAVPNDPSFSQQWGLNNTGQTGGVADADIDGVEAWDLTQGDNTVVVAVIDSGVDYSHPDLAANIFQNTADCNTNGIDDDGNGYIDDCHGIDPLNGDSDPADDNGHGTHVAGIIGAVGNNGVGVSGVAWNVKILPCKFIDANGDGSIADAITCLEYVAAFAARGVKVVATNNSWGGGLFSQALSQAVAAQRQQGILFIAAAGNDGADHDAYKEYPCSYDSPNIICVAAITVFDVRPLFSDFGRHTVHIGAPGFDILSTLPGNTYGLETGTSMASPHVAGVAALLKAANPARDWRAIRNLILAGGKVRPAMASTISQRELSASGALTCASSTLLERLQPAQDEVPMRRLGTPILLSMLHINCASPNGAPTVLVSGGGSVVLHDDGLAGDVSANDGIYSAQWTAPAAGDYTLTFPNGDTVTAHIDAQLDPGYPIETLSLASSYQGGPGIHTLVGNIDADPAPEILRSGLAVGPLYAWHGDGTPASGWPRVVFDLTGTYLDVSGAAYPVLGHFTGASSGLDVFANYTGLTKSAYDGAAHTLPGWPLSTYSQMPGAAADLDGDGLDEIIVEDNNDISTDYLVVHRSDGTALPGWPQTLPPLSGASKIHTPAVADLDGDGELEIIATDGARVYAYHRDGSVVTGFPVDLSATGIRSYPVVGDVDGDGAPEIVVISQVQDSTHAAIIVILSNKGVTKRSIVTPFEAVRDVAPALADLTGDGIPEIVLDSHAVGAGGLGVWRADGTSLSGWPVTINNWSGNTAPVVGDVDGDGAPDIVITTQVPGDSHGDVRAYDRHGTLLTGFPKTLNLASGAVPAIADLHLDGRNKVIVSGSYWPGYPGYYDTLWVFDMGGPAAHGPIEWGQFMNDEKHSGFYKIGKNLSGSAYLTAQVRGTGSIASSPSGIACGSDCIELYPKGTSVSLTANGDLVRWRGACTGQGNPCVISMQDYSSVVGQFGFKLSVAINGTGSGTVTSSPTGINCSSSCSKAYDIGTSVTLTATPAAGSTFDGWSGNAACSSTTPTCTVVMSASSSVQAVFTAQIVRALSVTKSGTGTGSVVSQQPGINCGADCSETYSQDTTTLLTATADAGSTFVGWTGACNSAAATCQILVNGPKSVTATFAQVTPPASFTLDVSRSGSGTGTVVSMPGGINCGADCSESYTLDTDVTLTASANADSVFSGWSGACSGTTLTCSVKMSAARSAIANFTARPTLSVTRIGTGTGTVTANSGGIDCGNECSALYDPSATVILTAHAGSDSVFAGWSGGGCTGTAPTCTVTVAASTAITASFTLKALLSVALTGNGTGTVSSNVAGISCGTDCNEAYAPSSVVTLTATAAQGSAFSGWSGACSGQSASCTVTMDSNKSVAASFTASPAPPSDGGGSGGGGRIDWSVLAVVGALLMFRRRLMSVKSEPVQVQG